MKEEISHKVTLLPWNLVYINKSGMLLTRLFDFVQPEPFHLYLAEEFYGKTPRDILKLTQEIYDREKPKIEKNNLRRVLIHSYDELVFLRFKKLVRNGKISSSDIQVLYLETEGNNISSVLDLRLNPDGTFKDRWPGGFFEESFDEIFGPPYKNQQEEE